MLKIEYVWRELLYRAIEEKNTYFTMTSLADKFGLSTSMVSHSLIPLRELGMVEIGKMKSTVIDTERLLLFWATHRNIKKDLIYTTHSLLPVLEREASMPHMVYPTCYSAYRLYFHEAPSDYDVVYFYANDINQIKKRFPENLKKHSNLFIIKSDPYLALYKQTPLAQVFADLWNSPEWYAKEFSQTLLSKIRGIIGL